jgi:hypothetical protein
MQVFGEELCPGLKAGGRINWINRTIAVSCLGGAIPRSFEVDVRWGRLPAGLPCWPAGRFACPACRPALPAGGPVCLPCLPAGRFACPACRRAGLPALPAGLPCLPAGLRRAGAAGVSSGRAAHDC